MSKRSEFLSGTIPSMQTSSAKAGWNKCTTERSDEIWQDAEEKLRKIVFIFVRIYDNPRLSFGIFSLSYRFLANFFMTEEETRSQKIFFF